jgi:trk system potassium uptake protein
MKILLVGGHQETRFLARSLKLKNYDVTVVNEDKAWCIMLADEYEVNAVCGDGTSPSILQNARTDQMDLVVALDHKDASNLLTCEISKKKFHVPKTIAVVTDLKNVPLFRELGVDRCISATNYLIEMIEQETITDRISRYLQIENGKVVIFEVEITEQSKVINQKLWNIGLPPQSIISCIIRGEQTIIPEKNTELKVNDKAIVLSVSGVMDKAMNVLTGDKVHQMHLSTTGTFTFL